MRKLKEIGTWQAQKIPEGAKEEHLLGKDATSLLVNIFGKQRLWRAKVMFVLYKLWDNKTKVILFCSLWPKNTYIEVSPVTKFIFRNRLSNYPPLQFLMSEI